MQYRFPEHDFSNDLISALSQFSETDTKLEQYREKEHKKIKNDKDSVSCLIRKVESSKRQIMQTSFSLLECYLNGLAWSFYNKANKSGLSQRKTNLLKDTSNVNLRDKITRYSKAIFDRELGESIYKFILEEAKPYRDSLMHPSPFFAPEKFSGYDKLEKLYNLNNDILVKTVFGVIDIIEEIEKMKGENTPEPIWLPELKTETNKALPADVKKRRG